MSESGFTTNYEEERQEMERQNAQFWREEEEARYMARFADPLGELVVEGGECRVFEFDLSKRMVKEV